MAFTLPNFNLTVDVYTGPWSSKALRLTTTGNLALGRRVAIQELAAFSPIAGIGLSPNLLVPAGTDVRDASCGPTLDFLEVPQGSGRWYQALFVDDIGKGFPNEHRVVTLGKIWQDVQGAGSFPGLFWPTPIP